MELGTSLRIEIDSQATKVHNGIVTASAPLQLAFENDYVNGSSPGSYENDLRITDNTIIADQVTKEYDLFTGLTDVFGDAVSFGIISGFVFRNKSVNVQDVVLGGNWLAALLGHASAKVVRVAGGGIMAWSSPLTGLSVINSTQNIFHVFNNSGFNVEYDLAIWGFKV